MSRQGSDRINSIGLTAVVFAAASTGAFAQDRYGGRYDDRYDSRHDDRYDSRYDGDAAYDYARVVDVQPLMTRVRVSTPQRECWDETRVDARSYGGPRTSAGGALLGAVIGGVIGQRRMLFDVWGETVNTASRMESSGLPGRIQLAPSTMELVRDRYQLAPREIEVKGMGPMTTYLLVE